MSIESAEERLQFMIVACRGDARLLEDLQSLVAASERPSILEQFRNEITTQKNSSQSRIKTAQVGPYRILRSLGQGGMGTVLLGEQETPIKRKVALNPTSPTRFRNTVISPVSVQKFPLHFALDYFGGQFQAEFLKKDLLVVRRF